jgi:hypothetical protein
VRNDIQVPPTPKETRTSGRMQHDDAKRLAANPPTARLPAAARSVSGEAWLSVDEKFMFGTS